MFVFGDKDYIIIDMIFIYVLSLGLCLFFGDRDYRMYYIIIDMIFIFIMCFWVGLWDQGFIGSLFVFIRIYDSMLFPFYVCFFGYTIII